MKIRNGFVSNSSSSSFIVAYKKEVCPCCGRSNADIVNMIMSDERSYDCDTDIIKGKTNVHDHITKGVLDSDYNREFIIKYTEKLKNIDENIYEVISFDLDYGSGNVLGVMQTMKDKGNLIVIYDEEEKLR